MHKDAIRFFEKNILPSRPVLIGLSGGPDSTCLLHLYLLWNKAPLHIVHIDHGWRAESAQECETIKSFAIEHGIPFHSKRLTGLTGNLEDASRQERFRFYKEVADQVGAQAVLLGHHAQDVSETVFKRMLEGSSLTALAGLHKVRTVDGLTLLRPLLDFNKKEIIAWLEKRAISYFTDPTNEESRYLRGRLRKEIFPYLQHSFGKEFEKSLLSIAHEAEELALYLDNACAPYQDKAIIGPWGIYYPDLPEPATVLRHILRPYVVSREQLQLAIALLQEGLANKEIVSSKGWLYIDRGRAFFTSQAIPELPDAALELAEGTYQFGSWHVTVEVVAGQEKANNDLSDVWKGHVSCYLPLGKHHLARCSKSDRHYFSEKKVPHFLVSKVPVVEGVADFFTGKAPLIASGQCLKVTALT